MLRRLPAPTGKADARVLWKAPGFLTLAAIAWTRCKAGWLFRPPIRRTTHRTPIFKRSLSTESARAIVADLLMDLTCNMKCVADRLSGAEAGTRHAHLAADLGASHLVVSR